MFWKTLLSHLDHKSIKIIWFLFPPPPHSFTMNFDALCINFQLNSFSTTLKLSNSIFFWCFTCTWISEKPKNNQISRAGLYNDRDIRSNKDFVTQNALQCTKQKPWWLVVLVLITSHTQYKLHCYLLAHMAHAHWLIVDNLSFEWSVETLSPREAKQQPSWEFLISEKFFLPLLLLGPWEWIVIIVLLRIRWVSSRWQMDLLWSLPDTWQTISRCFHSTISV